MRMKVFLLLVALVGIGWFAAETDLAGIRAQVGPTVFTTDSDADGCANVEELGTNPALGGLRDPRNPWDFYDVNGDTAINVLDIGGVVDKFGTVQGQPNYAATHDRSNLLGVPAYTPDDGPPDGLINILDIGLVVDQFGHVCSGPLPLPASFGLETVVSDARLSKMTGFVMVPDSTTEGIVLTQAGIAYRVNIDTGTVDADVFADISGRVTCCGELGLLGIAFSPDFATDDRVYLHYNASSPLRSVISRFLVDASGDIDETTEEVLLQVNQPFANHNGGQLAFGQDDLLYIALGDGGSSRDPQGNGQNLGTKLGKILRIDVSGATGYTIPASNPFVGTPGAEEEIYAYGLRNPWRFSFDTATGNLWAADVGQGDWEEVDQIISGGNYGWNIMEGYQCTPPFPVVWPPHVCNPPADNVLPVAFYAHATGGCSVTCPGS